MSGPWYQGALQQAAAEWEADSRAKGQEILRLREELAEERRFADEVRSELTREVNALRSQLKETRSQLAKAQKHGESWLLHYNGLLASRDLLLKLLDDTHGEAENPARRRAYNDEDDQKFRIPDGPRKGQSVTLMDHYFFDRFATLFRSRHEGEPPESWIKWFDGDCLD